MIPQVQTFFDAEDKATEAYNEFRRNLHTTHPIPSWDSSDYNTAEYNAASDAREQADRAAHATYLAAIAAARKDLIEAADNANDPTLKFLINTAYEQYPSETRETLRRMPMSRETLEEFGPGNRWCPEYGRLFHLAEAAGALPPYADTTDPFNHLNIGTLVAEIMSSRYEGSSLEVRKLLRNHLTPQLRTLLGSDNTTPTTEPETTPAS